MCHNIMHAAGGLAEIASDRLGAVVQWRLVGVSPSAGQLGSFAHWSLDMVSTWRAACRVACVCVAFAGVVAAQGQVTLRVKPKAPGRDDGASWATAFEHLQDALAAAQPGDQVWVAAGTYRPDRTAATPNGTGNRSSSFELVSGVAVYGGFAGTETELSQRDPTANVTILSGDLGENDGPDFANDDENAYHVITATDTAAGTRLDGFTVTGANTTGTPDNSGAGFLVTGGTITIANCTFSRNRAAWSGGGGFVAGGTAYIFNCRFLDNRGGAAGGGLRFSGGGIVANCLFVGNSAASGYGGALFTDSSLARDIVNCTFYGNHCAEYGGAFASNGPNARLRNCISAFNTAGVGPEIYDISGPAEVSHCLIQALGQPAYVYPGVGNINADPRWVSPATGDFRLTSYSPCVDRGSNALLPADVADLDHDGNTVEVLPIDLSGNVRVIDGDGDGVATVDMGAFERSDAPYGTVLRVKPKAPGRDDGASWATAFEHLQDALAAAQPGDQVWVAAGTYRPDRTAATPNGTGNRSSSFELVSGVAVYGGFAGTETELSQRDPTANVTILSGDLGENDGPDFANDDENAYHVITATDTAAGTRLDGFTVTGANTTGTPDNSGAGFLVTGGTITIANCTFSRNRAAWSGGGGFVAGGTAYIFNCRFLDNRGGAAGGGLRFSGGGIVANCLFVGNSAASGYGGALFTDSSLARDIVNCTFYGNHCAEYGGAFASNGPNARLRNCISAFNTAGVGPEIYDISGPAEVSHCLIQALGQPAYVYPGVGNINADPRWVSPATGDFRLTSYSPCVDRGSNALLPADVADLDHDGNTVEVLPIDLSGNVRVIDGDGDGVATVDMGAAERSGAPYAGVLYVARSASPGGTGESWATAIQELRDALPLAAALAGPGRPVQVWVAAGTYRPSPPLGQGGSRSASFELASNVAVYGGFAGTETELSQRDPDANVTILSGDLNDNEPPAFNNGDNSYHVVCATGVNESARLDGFTITRGNADGSGDGDSRYGGGILIQSATPHIAGCRFIANEAFAGGALASFSTDRYQVDRCVFSGNTASQTAWTSADAAGGAVSVRFSSPVFRDCVFIDNAVVGPSGTFGGGAMIVDSASDVALLRCEFVRNQGTLTRGGALHVRGTRRSTGTSAARSTEAARSG